MGKRTVSIPSSVVYDTGKLIIEPRGISVEFRYRTCIDGEAVVYYRGFEDTVTAELAIQMLARKELLSDIAECALQKKAIVYMKGNTICMKELYHD